MVISIVWFFVSALLFWADWFVIKYSWANIYDGVFRISENLLIPILAMMLITGTCSIVSIIKRSRRNGSNFILKSTISTFVLFIIVGICAPVVHSLSSTGYQVTAVLNIESKERDDLSCYYLLIKEVGTNNPVKIKCDESVYDEIIVDKNVLYTIEYRLDLFDSKSGTLCTVNLSDYIDNRKD